MEMHASYAEISNPYLSHPSYIHCPDPATLVSRRPMTRSQTELIYMEERSRSGISAQGLPKSKFILSLKKRKSSSPPPPSSQHDNEIESADNEISHSERLATPPIINHTASEISNISEATFLDTRFAQGPKTERRTTGPKSSLLIPVPNLTKKSRGRRVPTKLPFGEGDSSGKDKRFFVCDVEGCNKCFSRGEHLNRHIRSIHTNEKPFKCPYVQCDKYFNRHDNLLQHLKVHSTVSVFSSFTAITFKFATKGYSPRQYPK